jgi:predicted acyl esterase
MAQSLLKFGGLLAAASVGSSAFAASNTGPGTVTPMTPDVVASYDEVRPEADYVRRTVMIPMRDGVKLNTIIVMKKGATHAPMLLSRTPYNAKEATSRIASQRIVDILPIMDAEFVEDGYIRVYQDIRGMHGSEGVWVSTRPIVGPLNDTGIDESTDAYDTIAWLVKNLPGGNGKVGSFFRTGATLSHVLRSLLNDRRPTAQSRRAGVMLSRQSNREKGVSKRH